jgi:16S rRNA (uracil1498-N3)-methyltransferase
MRQFILPEDWDGGPSCLVEGGRARYVASVLSLGPGDSFPGLDSGGRLWTCTVVESERPAAPVRAPAPAGTGALRRHGSAPLPRIILVQGLPKGAKMDLVVRQATEAGVAAVLPLLSAGRRAGRSGQRAGRPPEDRAGSA